MNSTPGSVLVVDDNEDNRNLLSRLLQRQNHTVVVAADGRAALHLMAAQRFDLVLLDISMPVMDGYQVLACLKADPVLRHIPVIVISANNDTDSIVKCIELGAEDYLFKPFNAVLLHARVSASLEKKRLRDYEQIYLLSRLTRLSSGTDYGDNENGVSAPVPGSRADAPTVLDETMTHMLDMLEQAQIERQRVEDELKALNATLEQRVTERSAAAEQRAQELARSEEALRRQTRILQSILDSMGDGVVVTDAAGQLLLLNPAARRILDHNPEDLLACTCNACPLFYLPDMVTPYPPDELPLKRAMRGEVIDSAELFVRHEVEAQSKWLSVTARPLHDEDGVLHGGVAVFRDISASKRAEVALRESEERFALSARGANDGLWDWNLKTKQIYFSPRWKSMLGYAEHEIDNSPNEWFQRIHPDDRETVQIHLNAHFKRLITHFEQEHRMLHADGTYRWVLCRGLAVWDAAGRVTRMAGSQTDITDRKLAEEQLSHDALHDALTGLPNRALFMDRLGRALTRVTRQKQSIFAVLFLDLDRFKIINDSLGHVIGDQLLMGIAQRLQGCLRPGDTVARLGGDEFTLLLEDISDASDAVHIAERIQKELAIPFNLGGHEVFTTASIGITQSGVGYERPEDVLRDADTAMYDAKMSGKARHALFNATMHAHALSLLQLETDLRRALERREFRVYYQPIVSLETGCIAGFEALLRWQHPRRGFLSPLEFIPVAEETGLILPIGGWVLREACRQMRMWQIQFPSTRSLSISVNISGKQFTQPNLVEQIEQILRETGLSAESLKLEITESVIIQHGDATEAMLTQLRNLGVQLCIDDFGTGYSSLSYLHRFPVDMLKIDRSFVSRIGTNGENAEIVGAIVALAQTLGMSAVAEGTETEEQLAQLRLLKCDFGQGWWFSRAVDGEAAAALIASEMLNIASSDDQYVPPV